MSERQSKRVKLTPKEPAHRAFEDGTTMSSIKATVAYKKKDGTLSVSGDTKYLFWTPTVPPGATPSVTIPVADITNLQQTPESSPKVALKVFVKEESYVFSFSHKERARKEQEIVTDTLRTAISASKVATPQVGTPQAGTPAPANGDSAQPAAMAIARALGSKSADEGWYDDAKLKGDFQLQKSLLDSDKALKERFNQALSEKPESVSASQFTSQFWSARLHMLRAHAIDKAQKQGEYNVLPTIQYTYIQPEKEGEAVIKQLNITREQIKIIFKQYPVVRDAYNENSPPLAPGKFWERFFASRLLKKLKGEKITQQDAPDPIIDKYLDRMTTGPASIGHVPHYMDLEGNEQNHSQRKGNRPDETMRPSNFDKAPILRVLNGLSEKMLSHVAPEDGEAHGPIGLDEETFEQLRLRDLAMDDIDNRVVLNVREQQRLVGAREDDGESNEAKLYAKHDPGEVLSSLRDQLHAMNTDKGAKSHFDLNEAIGFDPDSDTEDDEPDGAQINGSVKKQKNIPRIGSKPALATASTNIMHSIAQQRVFAASDPKSLQGLPQEVYNSLTTTQNTTTEFLHYFWTLFLSGDASRTNELAQLVSTLDRSIDRINAVGEAAESARQAAIQELKRKLDQHEKRTGKRAKMDLDLPGGKKVVDAMIRPTVDAIKQAATTYRKALEEQTREAAAV